MAARTQHSSEVIDRILAHRAEGRSVNRVAVLLGMTKNQVSGILFRLSGSKARTDRAGGGRERTRVEAPLPLLEVVQPPAPAPVPEEPRRAHRPFSDFTAAPTHYPREMACQWIDGDIRRDGRFCGAERVPGRPYCLGHCQRAYYRRPVAEAVEA